MIGDGALTFREFVMRESTPLSAIHEAVLEFLRGRDDAVLYGAQAVNAYVDEPRMSQDVDLMSVRAAPLAEELRALLHGRFDIAVRVRSVAGGAGQRVYQVRRPKNRHLVDVRLVTSLPPTRRVDELLVLTPVELICAKVVSMVNRTMTPKGLTDEADLRRLLLTFPDLKTQTGVVRDRLEAAVSEGMDAPVLAAWERLVAQAFQLEDDELGY
jgi:hypothetical protein